MVQHVFNSSSSRLLIVWIFLCFDDERLSFMYRNHFVCLGLSSSIYIATYSFAMYLFTYFFHTVNNMSGFSSLISHHFMYDSVPWIYITKTGCSFQNIFSLMLYVYIIWCTFQYILSLFYTIQREPLLSVACDLLFFHNS